jgi:hypothetical protein
MADLTARPTNSHNEAEPLTHSPRLEVGGWTISRLRRRAEDSIWGVSALKTASLAMTTDAERYTGGCLCGALRYEVFGESIGSGHCYCVDCRRASGSGFIPFMGFKAQAVRFTGEASQFRSKAANGNDAVRNRCAQCMSLVFGGEIGKTDSYTIYAGSLDDPAAFHPTFAIFAEGRPPWAIIPPGFKIFARMPG